MANTECLRFSHFSSGVGYIEVWTCLNARHNASDDCTEKLPGKKDDALKTHLKLTLLKMICYKYYAPVTTGSFHGIRLESSLRHNLTIFEFAQLLAHLGKASARLYSTKLKLGILQQNSLRCMCWIVPAASV